MNPRRWCAMMVVGAVLLVLFGLTQCVRAEDPPAVIKWWVQVELHALVLPKDRAAFQGTIQEAIASLRNEGVILVTTVQEFGMPGSIHPEKDKRVTIYGRMVWELRTSEAIAPDAIAKILPAFCKAMAAEKAAGRLATDPKMGEFRNVTVVAYAPKN